MYSEPTTEKVKVAPLVPRSDECKIKTPALEGLIGGHTTYWNTEILPKYLWK